MDLRRTQGLLAQVPPRGPRAEEGAVREPLDADARDCERCGIPLTLDEDKLCWWCATGTPKPGIVEHKETE